MMPLQQIRATYSACQRASTTYTLDNTVPYFRRVAVQAAVYLSKLLVCWTEDVGFKVGV